MRDILIWLVEDDHDDIYTFNLLLNQTKLKASIRIFPTVASLTTPKDGEQPDILILDLNLPDSGGFGTFLNVRERFQSYPIIILTGAESDEMGELAVAMGAQDYLLKEELTSRLLEKHIRHSIERQGLINQLRSQVDIDELTLLYTKQAFLRIAQGQLAQLDREQTGAALIFIDLDDFKEINDTYGHLVGDQALRRTSQTLRNSVRSSDFASRFGGDEFTLYIAHLTSSQQLKAICAHIHADLNQPFSFSHQGRSVSLSLKASIGAIYLEQSCEPAEALDFADKLMYEVKQAGKNRFLIRTFQP